MWVRHAIVLVGLIGSLSSAAAQGFRIEETSLSNGWDVAQIKPATIVFNDEAGKAAAGEAELISFEDWTRFRPEQKKYLALFPGYTEPTVVRATGGKEDAGKGPVVQKLYMYVAQARFVLDRAPGSIDLTRYVTLAFLERIDPAIKHKLIAPEDAVPAKDDHWTGNENPERKWCTGRATLICIHSSYRLEGKIPLGIMLVNKLRDTAKKVSDHIDFDSEMSRLTPEDVDQAGLKGLTALDTPIAGVLEQNIFYVNQIMKFGKFFAVLQTHPTDAGKTVVTAYMALAIDAGVLEKKKEFEHVPVLRNLVPAQVLMGKSSFNSGNSISAGLPKYARNEIRTVADLMERDN